jgi:hypothetical protein
MRGYIDPKRFYKRTDNKGKPPKVFQVPNTCAGMFYRCSCWTTCTTSVSVTDCTLVFTGAGSSFPKCIVCTVVVRASVPILLGACAVRCHTTVLLGVQVGVVTRGNVIGGGAVRPKKTSLADELLTDAKFRKYRYGYGAHGSLQWRSTVHHTAACCMGSLIPLLLFTTMHVCSPSINAVLSHSPTPLVCYAYACACATASCVLRLRLCHRKRKIAELAGKASAGKKSWYKAKQNRRRSHWNRE